MICTACWVCRSFVDIATQCASFLLRKKRKPYLVLEMSWSTALRCWSSCAFMVSAFSWLLLRLLSASFANSSSPFSTASCALRYQSSWSSRAAYVTLTTGEEFNSFQHLWCSGWIQTELAEGSPQTFVEGCRPVPILAWFQSILLTGLDGRQTKSPLCSLCASASDNHLNCWLYTPVFMHDDAENQDPETHRCLLGLFVFHLDLFLGRHDLHVHMLQLLLNLIRP